MNFQQLARIYNTVKYLKFKQIYYRVYYLLRNKFFKKKYTVSNKPVETFFLNFYKFNTPESYNKEVFTFLNKTKDFSSKIDWNFSDYGKLWTYNLNYFDFLNQPHFSKELGLKLIRDYNTNSYNLRDGNEPYPTSLRTINWIKFLSKHKIKDTEIDNYLKTQYKRLFNNLEYHLLGNHLLENGFSLLFGSYFFKSDKYYKRAFKILITELSEQILEDGAHFELSPMYHQTMLFRVLDSIYLIENNNWLNNDDFLVFLREKAKKMTSFLQKITFSNGNIPMFNDSTNNIAPTTNALLQFALELKIEPIKNHKLRDSGYRKLSGNNYELILDIGEVGPNYQPAHAHADTFNFELYIKNTPIIVDRGISTYEKNKVRHQERSTSSHNTVSINNKNQTDVWGGFRVANRALPKIIKDSVDEVKARHNGYKDLGISHERSFKYTKEEIIVTDGVVGNKATKTLAHLHFHPNVNLKIKENNKIVIEAYGLEIKFKGCLSLNIEEYKYSMGFNQTQIAQKCIIDFKNELITEFQIK